MQITHWTLKIKWEDGTEEFVNDIPNFVASHVDPFLDALEKEKQNAITYEKLQELGKKLP